MGNIVAFIPGLPGYAEILVVAVIALLFFGKRLPDVARSLGKSIVEFKKGVRDIKNDVEVSSRQDTTRRLESQETPTLPSSPPASTTQQPPASKVPANESVNSGEQG